MPFWRRALGLVLWPIKTLLIWSAALLILFEEWGWEPLARALGWLAKLPIWARLEARIRALPPYGALALFALPAVLLFPVKLGALWLIGHGRALLGVGLIIAAKVLGTAVVARLFMLTQPRLMTLPWFAKLYGRWTTLKTRVLTHVKASAAWRATLAVKAQVRQIAAWLKSLLQGR